MCVAFAKVISAYSCDSQQNTMFFFVGVLNCSERESKEAIHQKQNDYLRKVLRSPACVMATRVLVTEVPMLVPMMIGTASWTVSTAKAQRSPSSSVLPTSSLIIIHAYYERACVSMCVKCGGSYSRPEDTMLTTMEEEVDELWTSRVTRTPMTRPARGLDSTVLSWKMSPAVLPGQGEHRHCQENIVLHLQNSMLWRVTG